MCICLCVVFSSQSSGRDLFCVYVCVLFCRLSPVVEICYVYMFVCVVLSSQSSGRDLLCVYVCVCCFVVSVQW